MVSQGCGLRGAAVMGASYPQFTPGVLQRLEIKQLAQVAQLRKGQ